MSSDSKHERNLTFTLSQGENLICERVINDLDLPINGRINIRNVLPIVTRELLVALSAREYDTTYSIKKKVHYDLLKYRNKIINSYPEETREIINTTPEELTHSITTFDGEVKEWDGVPIKFTMGFKGSANPVIERVMYVARYNPQCNQTLEVIQSFNYCVALIKEEIKSCEMATMWEQFDAMSSIY